MMAALLLVFSSLLPQTGAPGQAIRGVVVNAKTNQPIADAQVALTEPSLSARTDPKGRFEFAPVPPGEYTLTVSTIGYIFVKRTLTVATSDLDLTIPLAEGTGTYQETVTVSADPAIRPGAIGVSAQYDLGSGALADLRGVATDDPMRAIQALPGVSTGDDFQASFSVRGSAFRHVGIVIDGTPNAFLLHAIRGTTETGSISMINTDILSHASLTSGAQPRQDGDWLGATVQFDVREGSRDRFGIRAAVSGTSSSGVFEGPLGRTRRGSWLVSIRRSYLDWLVRKIEPEVDSTVDFSDAQAKLVWDLTPRQQLQFTAVVGDAAYEEADTALANGLQTARSRSLLGSMTWRYVGERAIITQRVSAIVADFANHGEVGQTLADGESRQLVWRGDAFVPLARGWTLEGGARFETLRQNETLRTFTATGPNTVMIRFERTGSTSPSTAAGWSQVSWRSENSGLSAGLRVTDRSTSAKGAVLPWVLAEHTFGPVTVRGGFGRSAQYQDPMLVAVALVAVQPSDTVPETANSYDVGITQPFSKTTGLQVNAFYREEHDVLRPAGENRVDPITGKRIVETPFPVYAPTLDGTSRGAEIVLMRRSPAGLSGWVSYSWSRTHYRDTLTGESFDGDFDQRHTFNVFAQQRLSYRMTVSGKLRVGSNFPLAGYFEGTTVPEALRLSVVRNEVRLPMYARLDVRANRTFTFQRSRLTLFVEVMNVLARSNLRQTDGSIRLNLEAVGHVDRLLPRVPSAGVLFEF
ncbi:MAG TPA: TonB-dependent receptor [Vicinamibacterales bacterium]|nr:TonB-dependent receptor [Vicinamibacterales bacterium]